MITSRDLFVPTNLLEAGNEKCNLVIVDPTLLRLTQDTTEEYRILEMTPDLLLASNQKLLLVLATSARQAFLAFKGQVKVIISSGCATK